MMFMAIKNQKLTYAFKEHLPLYTAFTIEYSPEDYIILNENKEATCYLLGNLNRIKKIQSKLTIKKFRTKLISDCIKSNDSLINYKFKSNLSKLSLKELQLEFRTIVKIAMDWIDIFLLTEAQYWKGIESKISKKEKDQLSKLRFNAKEVYGKYYNYVAKELLKNIFNKSKIKLSDISSYTYNDILALPKKPISKLIVQRKQSWGVIKKGTIKRLMTSKEINYYNNLVKKELNKTKTELKGISVYKGKVIGKVKIVKVDTSKKIKNLDLRNKILVTNMTQPNMIPFMKDCIGIITNEGGLLCHASIIAREFKIPCVVGTKHATQILKNNQIVELDANKGLVKIL